MSHLKNASRLDVEWDEYFPDNLKTEARSKRGKGTRRRVEPLNVVPPNWQQFLRISANKSELFLYLATTITSGESDKQIISTLKNEVRCIQPRDVSDLAPCTHEEADTRIILHVHDAVCQGYTPRFSSEQSTLTSLYWQWQQQVTWMQNLDCIWNWKAVSIYSSPRYCTSHWCTKMFSVTHVSHLYRL